MWLRNFFFQFKLTRTQEFNFSSLYQGHMALGFYTNYLCIIRTTSVVGTTGYIDPVFLLTAKIRCLSLTKPPCFCLLIVKRSYAHRVDASLLFSLVDLSPLSLSFSVSFLVVSRLLITSGPEARRPFCRPHIVEELVFSSLHVHCIQKD
jgi:hypothetical protein